MKLTLAQFNPLVGAFASQLDKIKTSLTKASQDQSNLVVFPELFLCGYPPADLLTRPSFLEDCASALDDVCSLSRDYPNIGLVVGVPLSHNGPGKGLYNSLVVILNGQIVFTQHKQLLPNYDVFDERRYFDSGPMPDLWSYNGINIGFLICEDAWAGHGVATVPDNYSYSPVESLVHKRPDLVICIAASPYEFGKLADVDAVYGGISRFARVPVVYVNQVGGQDELVFAGDSGVYAPCDGEVYRLGAFKESIQTCEILGESISFSNQTNAPSHVIAEPLPQIFSRDTLLERLFSALVLGLRDYVKKTGFSKVVLGLSGGIDSALVAVIATHALGAENVHGVLMPSKYSSEGSIKDSIALAANLGINTTMVPIENTVQVMINELRTSLKGDVKGITEENLQARIRGNILMAYSSESGALVLTTGNKSELSVGYCTLYGDMSGALGVIADVYKTQVYELSRWVNRHKEVIPEAILTKEPSAELRPDQKDSDSLPDYGVLDTILEAYLEAHASLPEIEALGYEKHLVERIIHMVKRNEYKRKQAAPGLKVSKKAFGVGRRIQLTSI